MGSEKDKGKLSAYERWELPAMGEAQETEERGVALAINPKRRKTDRLPPIPNPDPPRPPTAEELQLIRQQARDEGYREGHAEGHAQGRSQGEQQGREEGYKKGLAEGASEGRESAFSEQQALIRNHLEHLDAILHKLADPVRAEAFAVREQLLDILVRLLRAVLGREVSLHPEQLKALIDAALACLPVEEDSLQLHLHPTDEAFLRSQTFATEASLRLLPDPTVDQGGFLLQGRQTRLDQQLETRLQEVIEQWLATLDRPSHAE